MKKMRPILGGQLMVAGILGLASCGGQPEEEQPSETKRVLGARCWVQPSLTHAEHGYELCRWPESTWPGYERGKFFFPGVTALAARKTATQKCKDANALDEGYLAGPGESCYRECESTVSCIYPATPNGGP